MATPFGCNDKLVGAYAFLDTYLLVRDALPGEFCNNATGQCSARDANGHGTHTSSTAAGSHVDAAPLYGVDRGPISGIAPGAHVVMYRVCGDTGCFQSDSVAAVEQAIDDEVDVLNFSISGGASAYTDAVELAFLDAYRGRDPGQRVGRKRRSRSRRPRTTRARGRIPSPRRRRIATSSPRWR